QPLFCRIHGKGQLPVFQLELGRNGSCASLTRLPDAREQAEFALAQRLRDRLQLFGIPFGTSGLPAKRTRYDKCGDQWKDVKVPALFALHDVLLFEVRSKTRSVACASDEPFCRFNEVDKQAAWRMMFRSPVRPRRAVLLLERRARCARGGPCGL